MTPAVPGAVSLAGGLDLHRAGNLAAARAVYRVLLAAAPAFPDALHLLGVLERQSGDARAAVTLITRALSLAPDLPGAATNLENAAAQAVAGARALHAAGDSLAAIRLVRAVRAAAPGFQPAQAALRDLGCDALAGGALRSHAVFEALFAPEEDGAPEDGRPALLIAIPTFNRCDRLEACVREFLAQIAASGRRDVLLVVSDNGSDDGTDALMRGLAAGGGPLRYHRSPVNLGFELNLLKLLWLCWRRYRPEHVWTFGDDDHCAPDGLATVLKATRDGAGFLAFPEAPLVDTPARMPLGDLCGRVGFLDVAGYLSGCVFRPQALERLEHGRHLNSYVHSTLLLDAFLDEEVVVRPEGVWRRGGDHAATAARWLADGTQARMLLCVDAVEHLFRRRGRPFRVDEAFWCGRTRDSASSLITGSIRILDQTVAGTGPGLMPPELARFLKTGIVGRIGRMIEAVEPEAARIPYRRMLAPSLGAIDRALGGTV